MTASQYNSTSSHTAFTQLETCLRPADSNKNRLWFVCLPPLTQIVLQLHRADCNQWLENSALNPGLLRKCSAVFNNNPCGTDAVVVTVHSDNNRSRLLILFLSGLHTNDSSLKWRPVLLCCSPRQAAAASHISDINANTENYMTHCHTVGSVMLITRDPCCTTLSGFDTSWHLVRISD